MAYTDQQVADYISSMGPGATDRDIAAAMVQYGVGGDQVSRATNVPQAEVQSRFEAATNLPSTSSFSDQDVRQYLVDRPGLSDAQIASEMIRFGVGPEQMARVTQLPLTDVQARYDAVLGPLAATVVARPTTPTTPIQPIVPGPGITPTSPTLTPPNVPETLLPGNVGGTVTATPSISRDFAQIATEGGPTTATQYIQPSAVQVGGAMVPEYTEIPEGVTPLAVPALNVRNLINQGVVPNYVAAPQSSGNLMFEPIRTIGDRIF